MRCFVLCVDVRCITHASPTTILQSLPDFWWSKRFSTLKTPDTPGRLAPTSQKVSFCLENANHQMANASSARYVADVDVSHEWDPTNWVDSGPSRVLAIGKERPLDVVAGSRH
jgi:hypothetical protein